MLSVSVMFSKSFKLQKQLYLTGHCVFFLKLMLTKDKIITGEDKGYSSTPAMIELWPKTHEFLKHSETWDKTQYTVAVISKMIDTVHDLGACQR